MVCYALGVPSWGALGVVIFPGEAQAPFLGTVPSFWFKCESVWDAFTNGQTWIKCSGLLQW